LSTSASGAPGNCARSIACTCATSSRFVGVVASKTRWMRNTLLCSPLRSCRYVTSLRPDARCGSAHRARLALHLIEIEVTVAPVVGTASFPHVRCPWRGGAMAGGGPLGAGHEYVPVVLRARHPCLARRREDLPRSRLRLSVLVPCGTDAPCRA